MKHASLNGLIGLAGLFALTIACQTPAATARPAPKYRPGDAVAGKIVYQSCMGCHAIDENDVGPKHRGLVGRPAGTVPGYNYSAGLRSSGIVWTPQMIDRWLQGPQKLVPGTKMFFSIPDPKKRADLVAYLQTQK